MSEFEICIALIFGICAVVITIAVCVSFEEVLSFLAEIYEQTLEFIKCFIQKKKLND